MDTSTSPKRHHFSRTEVRWQVYFFTPHGAIAGETANISPEGALVSCEQLPPTEGNFRTVIKVPHRHPLDCTARVVWTTVCSPLSGAQRLGVDIQFMNISAKDRSYLQNFIVRDFQANVDRMIQEQEGPSGVEEVKVPAPPHIPHIADVRLPVFYNKGGKTVKAVGSRFSTKGCHLYTKLAPPKGAVFSLQMKNPRTGKSIKVDSSVVQCKRCAVKDHWGMVIRFMNLTGTVREEIREILHHASATIGSKKEPRYIKSKIGQSILKTLTKKRTIF